MKNMRRIPVLTGPTGVGKTLYVNALLDALPLHVVNMDSYQVFAFFCVGPGRSDARYLDRRSLYGYLSPHEQLNPTSYVRSVRAVVDELELAGCIPLFEGGSRSLLSLLQKEMPLQIFGLRPPNKPGWRQERLRRRVEGYFVNNALIREIEEGIRRGYADTQVMRDPLVYMQTRNYLAGKLSLDELKQQMIDGMLKMQDDQLEVFSRMSIRWVEAESCSPSEVVAQLRTFLTTEGWLTA